MPDYFALHKGSYLDSATFHLIATGTLAYMRGLTEGASDFDYRRFRANMLVDTGSDASGFIEDEWVGGVLEVGDTVKITSIQPALRCVMTTHAQQDLPRDLTILRTTVKRHQANLGAFTSIEGDGDVHLGDAVYLVNELIFLMAARGKRATKNASGNILRGRFAKGRLPEVEAFTASLPFDRRLFRHDIRGSIAHANMLAKVKLIARADAD